MRHLLTIFLLSFWFTNLTAQEKHFVFIQSDNKQPFYISVNGKLYSSSASGYVIIPKLTDGTYNITVGFAQNTFPEQTFSFVIQDKDLGFELKNFNEKGWGLFNLQSLDITMASSGTSGVVAKALSESINSKTSEPVISFEKKKDTASTVTERISVDPTNGNTIAKTEDVTISTPKTDSSKVDNTPTSPGNDVVATTTKANEQVEKTTPSDVKKVSEFTKEEGVHLAYVEGSGKTRDTINVIIPSEVPVSSTGKSPASTTDAPRNSPPPSTHSSGQPTTNSTDSELKFLDIGAGTKKNNDVSGTPKENTPVLENSNCKNIATEDDYAKLRKKMASETSDEKMINEARKYYRNKCFTTGQIKGLSTLFLSDEGRLKFFDASFVSVADAHQYHTLQTEFIDPAFVARFKEMLQ